MNRILYLLYCYFNDIKRSVLSQVDYEGIDMGRKLRNKLNLIEHLIGKKNFTIIESGAKRGSDTVKFAKKWPNAKIFSFEPYPSYFKKLQKKTKKYDNVSIFPFALNTFEGTVSLNISSFFSGSHSLLKNNKNMPWQYTRKIEVPCVELDRWAKQNEIAADFLWLDLEGLELTILQSSPKIVAEAKVIHVETNLYFDPTEQNRSSFDALAHFLQAAGFKMVAHWYVKGYQGDAVFIKEDGS